MTSLTPLQWSQVDNLMNADVNQLRLAHHGNSEMDAVITQVDCRQRTAKKLCSTLQAAPRFIFPTVLSAEQSTSDSLAAFHASLCSGFLRVLDLTCGLGIDSFHIARNVEQVTACEINPLTAECASLNARSLNLENVNVVNTDSEDFLASLLPNSFDCIFVDPARRGTQGKRLFALSACSPDVSTLLPQLLEIAPHVIIKASPMLDISHTIGELTNVTRVIALGDRRECKELVIECNRNNTDDPVIESVTIGPDNEEFSFSFNMMQERSATPDFGRPEPGHLLFEPFPSAIKSGAFNSLAVDFGLTKLAPNSHLYHFPDPVAGFPGRAFRIYAVLPFNKKGIREASSLISHAEVSTRNFPLKPEQVLAKMKIHPGGNTKIFASRDASDKTILILTTPEP